MLLCFADLSEVDIIILFDVIIWPVLRYIKGVRKRVYPVLAVYKKTPDLKPSRVCLY